MSYHDIEHAKIKIPNPDIVVLHSKPDLDIDELQSCRETDVLVAQCLYSDVHRGMSGIRYGSRTPNIWGPGGGHGGEEDPQEYYCQRSVSNPFWEKGYWICNYPIPYYSSSARDALEAIGRVQEIRESDPIAKMCYKSMGALIEHGFGTYAVHLPDWPLRVCKHVLHCREDYEYTVQKYKQEHGKYIPVEVQDDRD